MVVTSLFWRLAAAFFFVFLSVGGLALWLVVDTAANYSKEASYGIHRDVADRITHEPDFKPYVHGQLNEAYLDSLFHFIMVFNPNLEIYFLGPEGEILNYFAPRSKITMDTVDLAPIQAYLTDTTQAFLEGDDPRNPGTQKPFSVARVSVREEEMGYIYVVLQSEILETATQRLRKSYMISMGAESLGFILIIALFVSWVLLWLLTQNLNQIIRVVRSFQQGNHQARIKLKARGKLTQLAEDFNQMADTILDYIDKTKESEQQRKEFISNISHDLRAPLGAIRGYAEIMNIPSSKLTEAEFRKYSAVILAHTDRLQRLVTDLFQLSQLQAGLPRDKFETFSLTELIVDAVSQYQVEFEKAALELEVDYVPAPGFITGEVRLVDRAFQNLLQNALQYTPEGGRIGVSIEEEQGEMIVEVCNTGPGIPKEQIGNLFKRFSKGGTKEGSGLGLAIVKEIMDLHGGAAEVESEPGAETTFRLVFPKK